MQNIDLKNVYVLNKKRLLCIKQSIVLMKKNVRFFTYTTNCISIDYVNQTRCYTLSVVHDSLSVTNSSQPDTMPSILHIITGREIHARYS